MKHVFLILGFIPAILGAQRFDPYWINEAPNESVKSVKTTILIQTPKDRDKPDTLARQVDFYQGGFLSRHEYTVLLDHGTYFSHCEFDYLDKNIAEDCTIRKYKRGVLADSTIVRGDWANMYSFRSGKISTVHEYRGDSVQEKIIKDDDTLVRKRVPKYFRDNTRFLRNAGVTQYKHSVPKNGVDTLQLITAQGKCLMMVVTTRDANGWPVKTEHYNYAFNNFEFFRLTYNEKLDMTYYLEKSKNGAWSYQVLRKYDAEGMLIEEQFIPAGKKPTIVIKRYQYEYY